jgi:hypothetical protein
MRGKIHKTQQQKQGKDKRRVFKGGTRRMEVLVRCSKQMETLEDADE